MLQFFEDDAGMRRRAIWSGKEVNNIRRSKLQGIGNEVVKKNNVKLRGKIERLAVIDDVIGFKN